MGKKKKIKRTSKTKQKGLNGWQIAAIVFLILLFLIGMTALILYLTGLKKNQDKTSQEEPKDQPKDDNDDKDNGEIKVKEDENIQPDSEEINIKPKDTVKDENGNEFTVNTEINTGDGYSLSNDAKIAITLETAGISNEKVTINGVQTNGGFKVEGGTIYYHDLKGQPHSTSAASAYVTYADAPLDSKIIKLMDAITVDSTGKINLNNVDVFVSGNDTGTTANITYKLQDTDIEVSTKTINDICIKDGKYYSGDTELSDSISNYLSNYFSKSEITPPTFIDPNAPNESLALLNSQSESPVV